MAESHKFTINPYEDRSTDLSWLDAVSDTGAPLEDGEIPILDEPPFMAKVRTMDGGPYYIMPDSGVQVPTDFYANIDDDSIRKATEVANRQPAEGVTPEGKAVVPTDVRELLESGGTASKKLLRTLERGLDASSPELEKASNKRLRKAGLL